MRGILLGFVFFSLLPLIFIRGPFVGILMWFWVSLMAPQFVVWDSFFATIPYALIVAVATLLSLFFSTREPRLPPPNKTSVLLILMMVWISITSWFGTGPPADIYYEWPLTEKMLLMTSVAYALTSTRERLDQLITVCALSIAFYGLKGGIFTLLHGGSYVVYGPGNSMIGDNNELGIALTMILPLLFYLRQRYRDPRFRWAMLGVIGLTIIGDLFTYSRGALLAIGGMGVMAWLRSRHKIASAIMATTVAAAVWNFAPPQWIGRMETIHSYQRDASAEERLYMWRMAWAMALVHPILGSGFHWSFAPDSVNRELGNQGFHWPFGGDATISAPFSDSDVPPLIRPRAVHSIWFEVLSDHGFPGLILFIGILASAMIDARWLVRVARRRPDLAWADLLGRMLQASLPGFAIGGTFASLEFYDGFYAIVIVAAAARRTVAAEVVGMQARQSVPRLRPDRSSEPAVAARRASNEPRGGDPSIRAMARGGTLPKVGLDGDMKHPVDGGVRDDRLLYRSRDC